VRLGIEFDPVGVVIVGHIKLNYPLSFNYSRLYIWGTAMEVSLKGEVSRHQTMEENMDIGSANTSRALRGHPGNVSMRITRSILLKESHQDYRARN
jgi:hypothetical protein